MKLWEVYNGWQGESYVKVFVIAETEGEALKLAESSYRRQAESDDYKDPDYFSKLKAKILCENVSKNWASIPRDH